MQHRLRRHGDVRLKQPGKVSTNKTLRSPRTGAIAWQQIRPRRRLRQLARGGHPSQRSPSCASSGLQLRQPISAPSHGRRCRGAAAGKQLVAAADAQGGVALRLPFDFDRRHVHLIGAFAPQPFATRTTPWPQPAARRQTARRPARHSAPPSAPAPAPRRVGDLAADAKLGHITPWACAGTAGRHNAPPPRRGQNRRQWRGCRHRRRPGRRFPVAGPIQMVFHHGLLFTASRFYRVCKQGQGHENSSQNQNIEILFIRPRNIVRHAPSRRCAARSPCLWRPLAQTSRTAHRLPRPTRCTNKTHA